MTQQANGYTLVEMLVAMAVTSIVLAGTYAAYGFFSQQQQSLTAQTDVDRSALIAIDLMQSDIRMAGFKDVADPYPMPAAQAITFKNVVENDSLHTLSNPGDVSLVFDDYPTSGTPIYRTLIRYYLAAYTPQGGTTRNRLYRERRQCIDPSVICNRTNSTIMSGSDTGEPLLDWVSAFAVKGLNPKDSGSFANQYQNLQVTLVVSSPKLIEGTTRTITKNFTFLGRAKNVSLVP